VQLFLTLTKLRHIMRDRIANFHISQRIYHNTQPVDI